MRNFKSILFALLLIIATVPVSADQVWGDAVEAQGSNHDQFIEMNVTVGEAWETPLNVYVIDSGQAADLPVVGVVEYDSTLTLSKTDWIVYDYSSPDLVMVGKTESEVGSFTYDVIFRATTDLSALSKSFDKVSIKINVLEGDGNNNNNEDVDVTAPIVIAPENITIEATAVLTPVDIGVAVVDDPFAVLNNDSPGTFPIGTTVVTWTATDLSANVGTDEQLVTVVDTTAPVFITLPENKTVIYAGGLTSVDLGLVEATDIFPVLLTNNAPLGGYPLGETVVTWTATDENGNVATLQQSVKVQYQFVGFLQPINNNNTSIFKLGSTVPVKFKLLDAYGDPISTAVAKIYVAKITDSVIGSELEATSTSNATTGNLFRYDETGEQYIFNLSTKSLSKGSYQIRAILDDGMSYTVIISLR